MPIDASVHLDHQPWPEVPKDVAHPFHCVQFHALDVHLNTVNPPLNAAYAFPEPIKPRDHERFKPCPFRGDGAVHHASNGRQLVHGERFWRAEPARNYSQLRQTVEGSCARDITVYP